MTTTHLRLLGVAFLASLCACYSDAGVVTVSVKTQLGTAAADAVVVFDPLDATPPPVSKSVVIDQVRKTFKPLVTVIRTGSVVSFPNSDNIHHEVYSFSPPHRFKLAMYADEPHGNELFDKPGVVLLGCNIHDSMVAYVVVVNSPYFAKTASSGDAIVDLPPGRYRMRAWHPKLNAAFVPQDIRVGSDALAVTANVNLDSSRMQPVDLE